MCIVLTQNPPLATALRRPTGQTVVIGPVGCPVMIPLTASELMQCGPYDASLTVEHVVMSDYGQTANGSERHRVAIEQASDAEW